MAPPKPNGASPASGAASPLACQLTLVAVQLLLVIGAVYLKQALSAGGGAIQPVIFALVREAGAAVVLLIISYGTTQTLPRKEHLLQIFGLGGALFLNQLLYIQGVDLSGVLVASCIQPVIPVFTAGLAVALRHEPAHGRKLAGIALAVAGSVIMVAGNSTHANTAAGSGWKLLVGNLCLVGNTMAMAVYYLQAKSLQTAYPAVCLVAWAYTAAAICMCATAVLTVPQKLWTIPESAYGPVLYWMLVGSVLCYYALTWATKHLHASQVAAFQCLQPFYGALLATVVLGERLHYADAGAFLILGGLACVTTAGPGPSGGAVRARRSDESPPPRSGYTRVSDSGGADVA